MDNEPVNPTPEAKPQPAGLRMAVANGALLEVPVFESHHRGTNYMAVIDVDGTCPGGLSRRWIDRGKGECFYLIEHLQLFDPVEFAADYTTSAGKRHRKRWYGVVTAKTEDYILAEECKTGVKAVLLSKAKRTDPNALADAFSRERDVLLKRAKELDGAIDQLRSGAVTPEDVLVDHNPIAPPPATCPGAPGAASWGRCEKAAGHEPPCTHDPAPSPVAEQPPVAHEASEPSQ